MADNTLKKKTYGEVEIQQKSLRWHLPNIEISIIFIPNNLYGLVAYIVHAAAGNRVIFHRS